MVKTFLKGLKEGRVRNYIKRKYGSKAFNKEGTIKLPYLKRALKECKDKSLKKAIRLSITMRDWNR